MGKMTIGANNKPVANGKTTTFGFKCLEEQYVKLYQYWEAMGPSATGYELADQILKALPLTGLIIQNDDPPEILQIKLSFLKTIAQLTTDILKLLDGFGVQWRDRMKELEAKAAELANFKSTLEAALDTKESETSDLTRRCDSLTAQNASIIGEKEKADKLIQNLEGQCQSLADQVKSLNAKVGHLTQELNFQTDSVKAHTDENVRLGRKLQEFEREISAEQLRSQKQLAEQLDAERSKLESKYEAHRNEIVRLYEARIHDLSVENSDLKSELKIRSKTK